MKLKAKSSLPKIPRWKRQLSGFKAARRQFERKEREASMACSVAKLPIVDKNMRLK